LVIALALALEIAENDIQHMLRQMRLTHLNVRTKSNSVIIYSVESDGEAIRAILTLAPGNEFVLSIANHRGKWHLVPSVGELPVMLELLTGDLVFTLARWS